MSEKIKQRMNGSASLLQQRLLEVAARRHCSMCRVVHTLKTVARAPRGGGRVEGCYTMGAGAHDETPGSLYRLRHMPRSCDMRAHYECVGHAWQCQPCVISTRIFNLLDFIRVYGCLRLVFALHINYKTNGTTYSIIKTGMLQ